MCQPYTMIVSDLPQHTRESIRAVLTGVLDDDPLAHIVDRLRAVRDASNDDLLISLMETERSSMNVYKTDEVRFAHRHPTDVMISDIHDSDIQDIGEFLGKPNLAVATVEHLPTVKGILYGWQHRVFVSLPVRKRNKVLDVLFLYDTGSQGCHLRSDTFAALGYAENVPESAAVHINGFYIQSSLSVAHYANVNVLGQEFMRGNFAKVHLDFDKLEATIDGLRIGGPQPF